ncbi:MAG: energy transducer TonB [Chitinophagaceae bacterium]|nr:energy transducer TonB [Chitinophagaceae bacterium]
MVRKINSRTAVKAGAPLGIYTVKVQFVVGKQGEIASAEAVDVPAICQPCGVEAVKIIKGSPRWKPAVQFGHPVIYQAIQNITWSVEN